MIVTKEKLIELLEATLRAVREDDSFEGSLAYTVMAPGVDRGSFEVSAAIRVGNSEGQGGMMMINPSEEAEPLPF